MGTKESREKAWLLMYAMLMILMAACLLLSCTVKKKVAEAREKDEQHVVSTGTVSSFVAIDSFIRNVDVDADSIVFVAMVDSSGKVGQQIVRIYNPRIESNASGIRNFTEQKRDSSNVSVRKSESESLMNDTDTEVENFFDLTTIICVAVAGVVLLGGIVFFIWWKFRK